MSLKSWVRTVRKQLGGFYAPLSNGQGYVGGEDVAETLTPIILRTASASITFLKYDDTSARASRLDKLLSSCEVIDRDPLINQTATPIRSFGTITALAVASPAPTISVTAPGHRPRPSPIASRQNSGSSHSSPKPPRSPTKHAFGSTSARPNLRGRSERGHVGESYYMASASGSQTEGGDGADAESSSESEEDERILRARIFGPGGFLIDRTSRSSSFGTGEGGSPSTALAGESGRGGHVLVEKRSLSPSGMREKIRNGGDSRKERSWGSALLDTLEGNNQAHRSRRRPSSPAVHASRTARASPRGRSFRTINDSPPREASPPLTLDSLNSNYNPFPLFHIRTHLVFEVVILLIPFLFALYRLYTMQPTSLFPSIPFIPFRSLLVLAASVPFIALFRRDSHYFKAPFTDERGYRDPKQADDGVAAALTLPILLATAVYWETYSTSPSISEVNTVGLEGVRSLVEVWEAHGVHANATPKLPASFDILKLVSPVEQARSLFQARHQLVLLTSLNAVCLLVHLVMSRTVFQIEKLPRSNTKRFFGFMGVATGVSTMIWMIFTIWNWLIDGKLAISPLEAGVSTYIQQSSFYIVSRLARRGFTLGELNTMTAAGNALCLEFWRLTRSRWLYKRGFPYIPPTFRAPTPVIAFQTVLIPGAFFTGFLLSPLLVLSRHIASKPSHRLKWPTERQRHRKLLAFGVLVGLCVIVFLFLGAWIGWMLCATSRLRQPWIWAARFLYFGSSDGVVDRSPPDAGWAKRWKRTGLLAYWAGTVVIAVGGWQTHLVRARRIRVGSQSNTAAMDKRDEQKRVRERAYQVKRDAKKEKENGSGGQGTVTSISSGISGTVGGATAGGMKLLGIRGAKRGNGQDSNLSGRGGPSSGGASESVPMGRVGAESARETKAVHASLNMRRKFFHALAVLMFVPGIAIDPAFTSLAFSVAFALFTFAEYARFFALYPIGGPLHIFFTEFIDSKDGGPVILSHFYLLTGCAGGLWLEGRGINRFTGVLVLGIGDSLASIVGKLVGRVRWPGTSKTVEGTCAFVISILFGAWLLRLAGLVPYFSLGRYFLAVLLSALFEAASSQNDNLVIPIYMWSVISLLNV